MSTRSQVKVENDVGDVRKVTFYHHWDGYPQHILSDIVNTFKDMVEEADKNKAYKGGRVGKVANGLCGTCKSFEPLDYHELHGDIEHYYLLKLRNPEGTHVGIKPEWDITHYTVRLSMNDEITDNERLLEHEKFTLPEDKGRIKDYIS